jgi:hypothetical protein
LVQGIRQDTTAHSPEESAGVTILQFLVGALVTMGGTLFAALALSEYGRILGLVQLSVGVMGLAGGYAALRLAQRSKKFLLGINVLTIAYSAASEGLVETQSLLPGFASLGSLVGTIVAVVMSGAIIYLLSSGDVAPPIG